MTLSFDAVHWGETPRRDLRLSYQSGGIGYAIAELLALSYVTRKAGQMAVWRHEFEAPTYLLSATAPRRSERIEHAIEDVGAELVSIGRVIDLETVEHKRIVPGFWWVCFDSSQARPPVVLAALDNMQFALSHSNTAQKGLRRPWVTSHGIEG